MNTPKAPEDAPEESTDPSATGKSDVESQEAGAEGGASARDMGDEAQGASGGEAPLPVVTVGASAGGLEALQQFFKEMPVDSGIGFVVVTHTRADRVSLLPELIANVTDMPVVSGDDGVRVEANKIIVAKDSLLRMSGGRLRYVTVNNEMVPTHHPIDHLFRSTAKDQGAHSVCVVLSGTGSDGAVGLKAVKAAGGMVMVQDPESAKYGGMPESARATGLADYVLPPGEMPLALVEYCRSAYFNRARREKASSLPDDAIQAILVCLRRHTGDDFNCYKKSTISRRIERRMNVHRIAEPDGYLKYVRENRRELDLLFQELLISVTSFFRDPEAYQALAEKGVPKLLANREDGCTLRAWVPGCATGEEAYSVAILLLEQIHKEGRAGHIQVFATDLDERAIAVARNGIYPEGIAADVSQKRLDQYFSREEGAYRVNKYIREMIVFARQNILSDPPFSQMDLIVCRNLLIYLNAEAQEKVLPLFHYAMRPHGLLFLGSSETVGASKHLFETIDAKHKIMQRVETPGRALPALIGAARHAVEREESRPAALDSVSGRVLSRSVERLLLHRYAPCSVVVDEQDTVVFLHGRSGAYLEPEQGRPRNNLIEMAREGLRPRLAQALGKARAGRKEIVLRGVSVRANGRRSKVDATVRPLAAPQSLRGLVLVTFAPAAESAPLAPRTEPLELAPTPDCEEMEQELRHTRESLQSTIEEMETSNEELKSSNEELQSTNEELNSANEELETSREEMQSLNEELNTVNAELQSKVDALARSNDDMANLLNSMQIAAIFLDNELRVQRYTDQARDVVRLIESDIGRPLSDLTSSLKVDDLAGDCRRVLSSLVPSEREVQDQRGKWHILRVLPYRTADNVIDGVVVTIVSIEQTKRNAAAARQELFESIVQTVREPFMVLDGDLRVVLANDAFHRAFDTQPNEVEGQMVYDLGNRQWDIPSLRSLLQDVLPKNNVMSDFRVEHDFPRIGRREFALNARKLRDTEGRSGMILLAFENVTERDA